MAEAPAAVMTGHGAVGLVAALTLSACAAETPLYFHGTVIAGDRAGHAFARRAPRRGATPVPGATVRLAVDEKGAPGCRPDRGVVGRTGDGGEFRLPVLLVPATLVRTEWAHVCVRRPGFHPYHLQLPIHASPAPLQGQRFLNVRVRRQERSADVR